MSPKRFKADEKLLPPAIVFLIILSNSQHVRMNLRNLPLSRLKLVTLS